MTLSKFIESIGDDKAAELFGVSRRCASSWRQGTRSPRKEKAKQIVKKTDRKVTLEGIYG
jgi:DNA-binding transcriptional regulator YdaS (Cro superfamily)